MSVPVNVHAMTPGEAEAALPELSALLVDAVEHGASVNFMAGFTAAEAEQYWLKQLDGFRRGDRIWMAAKAGDRMVGTVMCVFAPQPNQPFRAEVVKMLVHSSQRRRGIGAALMTAVEKAALAAGRTLLVLDTGEGEPGEKLYRRMGWLEAGRIPGFGYQPDGTLAGAVIFYKPLAAAPVRAK
jgi:GNAT superfamily N-acetyltransferase